MSFQLLCSNASLINRWIQAFQRGTLHPVQLFVGPEGSEALMIAYQFAKFLLCEQRQIKALPPEVLPTNLNDSCGQCGACLRVDELSHPDLHFIYPIVNNPKEKKTLSQHYYVEWKQFLRENPYGNLFDWLSYQDGANKQPNINTEECRNMITSLYQSAYEGRNKVFIIWLPEFLGAEANRLLKVLEEPMDNTYLFFVTQDAMLLLPTFKSRMLNLSIALPSDDELKKYIKQFSLSQERSLTLSEETFVLQQAKGNLRLVHQYLQSDQDVENKTQTRIIEMVQALEQGPIKQVQWVEQMVVAAKHEVLYFFSYLHGLLHQLFIQQAMLISQEEDTVDNLRIQTRDALRRLFHQSSANLVDEVISKTVYALRRNAHPKMELLDFLLKMDSVVKYHRFWYPMYQG